MEPWPPAPPLPPSWPYAARGARPEPSVRTGAEPCRAWTGAWTLEALPGLDLGGPPEGLEGAFGRGGVFRCGGRGAAPLPPGGPGALRQRAALPAGPGGSGGSSRCTAPSGTRGCPPWSPWAGPTAAAGGCEGVYLTRFEGGPLAPRLEPGALPQVRALLAALCAWGLYAPDLNATNFLVRPDGQVLALDWDRARWVAGAPLLARYRARLARSLVKLGAPREIVIESIVPRHPIFGYSHPNRSPTMDWKDRLTEWVRLAFFYGDNWITHPGRDHHHGHGLHPAVVLVPGTGQPPPALPYMGLILFVALPVLFLVGLVLMPLGM